MSSGGHQPAIPTAGRRERRKVETRARLLDEALSLFVKKGYVNTSIEDIAEAADVARTTVFNYFDRKELFIAAWVEPRRAAVAALIAADLEAGVPAGRTLARGLAAWAGQYAGADDRALVASWLETRTLAQTETVALARVFEVAVAHGRRTGEFRTDLTPLDAALALVDLAFGTLVRWALGVNPDDHRPLPDRMAGVLDVVTTGIARCAGSETTGGST